MLTKEEIIAKIPHLSAMLSEIGAWPEVFVAMDMYANQDKEKLLDELGEKEVMIKAFADIQDMFENRYWIMEGRGCYLYNDDRYKEEMRYLYDDFCKLKKDVWKNIKTKTFEYREKIIAEYANQSKGELITWIEGNVKEYDAISESQKGALATYYLGKASGINEVKLLLQNKQQ